MDFALDAKGVDGRSVFEVVRPVGLFGAVVADRRPVHQFFRFHALLRDAAEYNRKRVGFQSRTHSGVMSGLGMRRAAWNRFTFAKICWLIGLRRRCGDQLLEQRYAQRKKTSVTWKCWATKKCFPSWSTDSGVLAKQRIPLSAVRPEVPLFILWVKNLTAANSLRKQGCALAC